jgi:hypothetical protein
MLKLSGAITKTTKIAQVFSQLVPKLLLEDCLVKNENSDQHSCLQKDAKNIFVLKARKKQDNFLNKTVGYVKFLNRRRL